MKKIVWMRQLLEELGLKLDDPTPVYGDNVQANKLCKEHFISSGNQYILTQYHYNKERIESGDAEVHWIHSPENPSDLMTKAVGPNLCRKLVPYITGHHNGFEALFEATQSTLTT